MVVLAWVSSRAVVLVVLLGVAVATERSAAQVLGNWDVQHFATIAGQGYAANPQEMAFFPGLPLLMRAGLVLGLDPVTDRQALRPQLGIMLQSGGLPAALTVAETMRMWAGTCSTLRDIDEVLVNVDLTHRADVKVGALSGGEQRRPDLACALVGDPRVIFPMSRRRAWTPSPGATCGDCSRASRSVAPPWC